MSDGAHPVRRLRRRPDFLAAAGGRRFHTDRLTAQGRLRATDEVRDGGPAVGLHLGFTVTKRVGHAPERNRIRRRLRRAVDLAAVDLAACACDVVVVARRPSLDAPFETLVDDLRRALAVVTKPRGPGAPDTRGNAHIKTRTTPRTTTPPRATGRGTARPTSPDSNGPRHGSTDG